MYVHREKVMWARSEKVVICKPRRKASGEIKLAGTFLLDF